MSGMAPEREAFLRRFEGEREQQQQQPDETQSHDETLQTFLQESGLGSITIDPSSLEALRDHLGTPKSGSSHHARKKLEVNDNSNMAGMPPPPDLNDESASPSVQQDQSQGDDSERSHVPPFILRPPKALMHATSDLTMGQLKRDTVPSQTDDMDSYKDDNDDNATDAATGGSTVGNFPPMTASERRILDQLDLQTAILMDVQRRLDELTNLVLQQSTHGGGLPRGTSRVGNSHQTTRDESVPVAPVPHLILDEDARRQAPRGLPDVLQQPPPQQQQQPEAQPEIIRPVLWRQVYDAMVSIPTWIRSTRVAEIWHVFWTLHNRQLGRLDYRVLIKILFMSAVIMAKLTASHKRKKKSLANTQFIVAIICIAMGYLMQSGYLSFLYTFFIKEQYPDRIWRGEQIDLAPIQAPRVPPRPPNQPRPANQPQAAAVERQPQVPPPPPPREDILGGAILRARAEGVGGVGGMILGFFLNIICLLGSFILSIFPMWKPEVLRDANMADRNAEDENVEDDNEAERPHEEQQDEGDDGDDDHEEQDEDRIL